MKHVNVKKLYANLLIRYTAKGVSFTVINEHKYSIRKPF